MKKFLFFLLIFRCAGAYCQSSSTFAAALSSNDKAIQAIHKYPEDVKDGECHHVQITSFVINAGQITITETWKDYRDKKATTVLSGTIENDQASGKWKSSFSSGTWSYNFTTNQGQWNKTGGIFGSFKSWQKLSFRIIGKNQLRDGFYKCSL